MENLFSVIRGKGGHGDNPNPKQFRLFLRQVMVDSILVQSKSSNCAEEGERFLLTLSSMTAQRECTSAFDSAPAPSANQTPDPFLAAIACNLSDEDMSLIEKNVAFYIAGYIAKRLSDKVCAACKLLLVGPLEGTLPNLEGKGLISPSSQLYSVVQNLEMVFKNSEDVLHMSNTRATFYGKMEKEIGDLVCPSKCCKLGGYVLNLFLNIRLHFAIKENNKRFAAASGRQNRKMLKLQHRKIQLFQN